VFARDLRFREDHGSALESAVKLQELREGISAGDVYVFRRVYEPEELVPIRRYLEGVGRTSLPNYHRIDDGCPNFHRIDRWDSRAYVGSCFHQFSFFPWNADVFGLFERFRDIFHMRNLVCGVPREKFLGTRPEEGCIARLSFQFYPAGLGGMNKHEDPIDHHQLTVPTLTMTAKGKDYDKGGGYVELGPDRLLDLDEVMAPGDVVYFNAQVRHGVAPIDPEAQLDWLSFRGRWILLFAVNKLASNTAVGNAAEIRS